MNTTYDAINPLLTTKVYEVEYYFVISKKTAAVKVVDLSSPKVELYRNAKRLGCVDNEHLFHMHHHQLSLLEGRKVTHLLFKGDVAALNLHSASVTVKDIIVMDDEEYEVFSQQIKGKEEKEKAVNSLHSPMRKSSSVQDSKALADLDAVYILGIYVIIFIMMKSWGENIKAIKAQKEKAYFERIFLERVHLERIIKDDDLKRDRIQTAIEREAVSVSVF